MIRERVLKLGKSNPLVGVLSEPPPDVSPRDNPGVLLLNSGILHRVGPCRLHVRLARKLAADGYQVLRFDFSGIGDSDVRRDGLAFEKGALIELGEVMDQLGRTRQLTKFVPMGLCSGADMALEIAKADPRVVACAMLDLWAYRTPGYYLRHYGHRLLRPSTWPTTISYRLAGLKREKQSLPDHLDVPTYVREFPPRAKATADLAKLMDRGVKLRCIFSGGQIDTYNHEGQFRAAFASVNFRDQLDETFMPTASHIFTNLDHQREVIDSIARWIKTV